MQQLFATFNNGKTTFGSIKQTYHESPNFPTTTETAPNADNFNTLQAMFATNIGFQTPGANIINMGQQAILQVSKGAKKAQEMLQDSMKANNSEEPFKVRAVDFNTMQQLFGTHSGVKENSPDLI